MDLKTNFMGVALKDPFTCKRARYVDILMKSEEIFKNYPLI